MVVPGSATDKVTIDGPHFFTANPATDFQIKATLWHTGYRASLDHICICRYFDTMIYRSYWFVVLEEIARDSNKMLVVTDVFRSTSAKDKKSRIVGGVNIRKCDICFERISLVFPCDLPPALGGSREAPFENVAFPDQLQLAETLPPEHEGMDKAYQLFRLHHQ
jgi:hypothetical protein